MFCFLLPFSLHSCYLVYGAHVRSSLSKHSIILQEISFFFPFQHTEPNRKTFRIHPITIQSFCIRLSIQNLSKRNLQCQFNFNLWNILHISYSHSVPSPNHTHLLSIAASQSAPAGAQPQQHRHGGLHRLRRLRGHDPAQTQPSRPCRHGQLATARWTEHDL